MSLAAPGYFRYGSRYRMFRLTAVLIFLIAPLYVKAEELPAPVRTFFEDHCVKCHSGESPKGDLTFEPLLKDAAQGEGKLWGSVLEKLETGEMPPKSKPRPPADGKLAV